MLNVLTDIPGIPRCLEIVIGKYKKEIISIEHLISYIFRLISFTCRVCKNRLQLNYEKTKYCSKCYLKNLEKDTFLQSTYSVPLSKTQITEHGTKLGLFENEYNIIRDNLHVEEILETDMVRLRIQYENKYGELVREHRESVHVSFWKIPHTPETFCENKGNNQT